MSLATLLSHHVQPRFLVSRECHTKMDLLCVSQGAEGEEDNQSGEGRGGENDEKYLTKERKERDN